MSKSMYYRNVIGRANELKVMLARFFLSWASFPRLLLEVFIRKDFGERYFKLSAAVTLTFILGMLPLLIKVAYLRGRYDIFPDFISWYVFLAAFLFVSIRHHRSIKQSRSSYDFSKYSLCSGTMHPFFFTIKLNNEKPDVRTIETILEPAPFFLLGIVLTLLQQPAGYLLLVSSVFYCASYFAAYFIGDHYVLDKIDEIICNEELERSFVDDRNEDETRGFRFRGHRPANAEVRRKLLPMMLGQEEEIVAR